MGIAETLIRRAEEENTGPLAGLTLDQLAELYGVSRSTLLRQVGTRTALDDALAAAGAGTVRKHRVADRAVAAAAAVIAANEVEGMTPENVASAVGRSVQAIHAQIGGRDALLVATFARFSPMTGIAAVLAGPRQASTPRSSRSSVSPQGRPSGSLTWTRDGCSSTLKQPPPCGWPGIRQHTFDRGPGRSALRAQVPLNHRVANS